MLAVGFDYPGEPEATEVVEDMDRVLRDSMLWLIYGGHRDALLVRVATVARVLGEFDSDVSAALAAGCDRTTIYRATRRLRKHLAQQYRRRGIQARLGQER